MKRMTSIVSLLRLENSSERETKVTAEYFNDWVVETWNLEMGFSWHLEGWDVL